MSRLPFAYLAYTLLRDNRNGPGLHFIPPWLTDDCAFPEYLRRLRDLPFSGPHCRPQHEFICDPNGVVLVDEVLRTERLSEMFAAMCARFGVTSTPFPKKSSTHKESFDPQSVRIVNELYRRDFELFGYPLL
jgi:Sulfotransferase family